MKKWLLVGCLWSIWSVLLLLLFDLAVIERWFYHWVHIEGFDVKSSLPFYPTNITKRILMDGFSITIPYELLRLVYTVVVFALGVAVFSLAGVVFKLFDRKIVDWKWVLSIYNLKNILFMFISVMFFSALILVSESYKLDEIKGAILFLIFISIFFIFGYAGEKAQQSNKVYYFNWKWIGIKRLLILLLSLIVFGCFDYLLGQLYDVSNTFFKVIIEILDIAIAAVELVFILAVIFADKFSISLFLEKYFNRNYVFSFIQLKIITLAILSFFVVPFILFSIYLIYFIPQIAEFSRDGEWAILMPVYVKWFLSFMDFIFESWYFTLPIPVVLFSYKQISMLFTDIGCENEG